VKNESNQRKVPTRRDVLRILAVGGAGVVVWRLGRLGSRERAAVTRSRLLMGTEVRLTVLGDDREAAEAAADATLERMSALESLLTRYREDSEVSRLNGTGQIDDASDALLDVLRLAHHVSRLGDGAFDITVQPVLDLYRARRAGGDGLPGPEEIERAVALVDHGGLIVEGRTVTLDRPGMRVTLDGIGKGYVVDAGVAVLRERGFPDVFVDAGGDLVAAGDNMQPFTPDLIQHHILDPRTGYSAPELASATVIAGDAATADALATLSMVLGPQRGRELLEDLPDCEGYLVAKDLEVTRTTGFAVL
jgi:thiamine biosynthesis lipoprotein